MVTTTQLSSQEEEQKRLEMEMQKRRERIERWRAERKMKELEATKKDGKAAMLANLHLPAAKKWSLEDDSDEEAPIIANKDTKDEEAAADAEEEKEPVVEAKKEDEEEIDTLDAFMAGVQEEVRKVSKLDNKNARTGML